jgi:beta-lactamase class A
MKRYLFCFIGILLIINANGQTVDFTLQNKIIKAVKNFNGEVGVYVKNMKTGIIASYQADSIFPTASLIKVPIMCGIFKAIEDGKINYHDELIYKDSLLYAGEDILGSFKDGEKIALSKVQMLSITTSDNTASLWLQKLAGEKNINTFLESNGFSKTRLNSRIAERISFQKKYGWGMTSPKEMAILVEKIANGEIINKASSERMYRYLTRIYWDDEALSQIPPKIQVASKQGAVNQSRSEVCLVNAPHGDYVFCVITKNQKDESWTYQNEGFVLLRDISKLLWDYFEPDYGWKPTLGYDKFY